MLELEMFIDMPVVVKVAILLVALFFISFALQKLFPPTAKDYERQEEEIRRRKEQYELEEKLRAEREAKRKAKNQKKSEKNE